MAWALIVFWCPGLELGRHVLPHMAEQCDVSFGVVRMLAIRYLSDRCGRGVRVHLPQHRQQGLLEG